MNKKKELGQFYTTNSNYITKGLLNIFPEKSKIIDPFAGQWDLLNLIKDKHIIEAYDLDPQNEETIKRNTLLNSPSYKGKWIFTNPPYLHRSRAKEKLIFDKYNTDDLYKASILSILECEGGILIIPTNFFNTCDTKVRKEFLNRFQVVKLKVFEHQVFEDTGIPVCAFSFIRKESKEQILKTTFLPSNKEMKFVIREEDDYIIGKEILNLEQSNVEIKRIRNTKEKPEGTYLHLQVIDKGNKEGRLKLFYSEKHYYGDEDSRAYTTITFNQNIPRLIQRRIVEEFNKRIEEYREKYNSMFLTNYMNSVNGVARKRISYNMCYIIISNILCDFGY